MSLLDKLNFSGWEFTLVGFFGQQAVRLLRESWDGILRAKPDGEIVPHGANDLSQELFAMFDDNIPQTQNAPVTYNSVGGDTPLTINNASGGTAIDIKGGTINITNGGPTGQGPIGGINIEDGGTFNITNGGGTFTGGDFNYDGGTFTFQGGSFEFKGSDLSFDDSTTINGQPAGGGGGGGVGTTVFLGKVVSGSGNTYQVALYGKGSSAGATATVTAKVPQIASGETIPAGTWLTAVHQFSSTDVFGNTTSTYEFQPPIWLA